MKKDEIFYSLCIDDIQHVANEEFGRNLIHDEIEKVKEYVCDRIDWYGVIEDSINAVVHEEDND